MAKIPNETDFEKFERNFNEKIVAPLYAAGYDQYNIFRILNIQRQELRHSDFLKFLFSPKDSKDIGASFLKNFLILAIQEKKISKIDCEDVRHNKIENINVDREFYTSSGRRIDLLIEFEITKSLESQKYLLVIENKIDSKQHNHQLSDYRESIENAKEYKKHKEKYYLYLTPHRSDLPEDGKWKAINYDFILKVLEQINLTKAHHSVKNLVEDYKKIIRSEFMEETEAKDLALKIYRENQSILDFIFQTKNELNWVKEAAKIFCQLLREQGATIVCLKNDQLEASFKDDTAYIMFTTPELNQYAPHYHGILFFEIYVTKLNFILFKGTEQKRYNQKSYSIVPDANQAVQKLETLIVSNPSAARDFCQQIVDRIFAKDGIINQCLDSLKNTSHW